jgi:hypothetical protein
MQECPTDIEGYYKAPSGQSGTSLQGVDSTRVNISTQNINLLGNVTQGVRSGRIFEQPEQRKMDIALDKWAVRSLCAVCFLNTNSNKRISKV